MKKIFLLLAVFMGLAFSQDHNTIPGTEAPYYFYGYSADTVRLGIEYIEQGQVETLYSLAWFDTYDSCFIDIYNKGLIVHYTDLGIDSTAIINKIDSLGIPDFLDRIYWEY